MSECFEIGSSEGDEEDFHRNACRESQHPEPHENEVER